MTQTNDLLSLADQFPQAFWDEPPTATTDQTQVDTPQDASETTVAVEPTQADTHPDEQATMLKLQDEAVLPLTSMAETANNDTPVAVASVPVEISHPPRSGQSGANESTSAALQALMAEFPMAFADPNTTSSGSESAATTSGNGTAAVATLPESEIETSLAPTENDTVSPGSGGNRVIAKGDTHTVTDVGGTDGTLDAIATTPSPITIPSKDYAQALQRHIPTFTWGQVEIYLTYNRESLQSIWVTVGKSGTEVQSLCEGIARLINLLLAHQVPIPLICHQIRGIRGADSEGLGPNRVLGLVDLIGKALQEAPEQYPAATTDHEITQSGTPQPAAGKAGQDLSLTASQASAPLAHSEQPETEQVSPEIAADSTSPAGAPATDTPTSEAAAVAAPSAWLIPESNNLTAMLCPECGAELQHMNGCSGGACPVCGYSSCS